MVVFCEIPNAVLLGMFGGWEIAIIAGVIIVLFGARKLPELGEGIGKAVRNLKKGLQEDEGQLQNGEDDIQDAKIIEKNEKAS